MLWYFPKIELWMWPPLVYPREHMAVRDRRAYYFKVSPLLKKMVGRMGMEKQMESTLFQNLCPHTQRSGGSVPEPVLTVNLGIVEMSPLSSRAVVLELPVAATC